jgi:hypothetical protein
MISREAVKALAYESGLGGHDPLSAVITIGLCAESAADCHRKLVSFVEQYAEFARRRLDVEARQLLREIRTS